MTCLLLRPDGRALMAVDPVGGFAAVQSSKSFKSGQGMPTNYQNNIKHPSNIVLKQRMVKRGAPNKHTTKTVWQPGNPAEGTTIYPGMQMWAVGIYEVPWNLERYGLTSSVQAKVKITWCSENLRAQEAHTGFTCIHDYTTNIVFCQI